MTRTNEGIRHAGALGGLRLLIGLLVALAALAAFPALQLFGKPATQPPVSVHVYDEAGILSDRQVIDAISGIEFVRPVKISILTLPSLDGESLNYRTLEYGRTAELKEPWISAEDPRFWADQTVILSLAPHERNIGTFFGEDFGLDINAQLAIQESMKDNLRAMEFNEAFYTGAQSVADAIDTSWANSILGWVASSVASIIGVSWFVSRYTHRARSKRLFEEARTNYAQVTQDFEATSIDAGVLDQTDIHGRRVYERYEQYLSDYHELTRMFQDFGSLGFIESLYPRGVKNTRILRDKALALNAVDDGISNTAAFLSMAPRWPEVWRNETGPLYEDIDSLEELISDARGISEGLRTSVRAEALKARHRLWAMARELEARTLSPSDALSELDRMSSMLWNLSREILEAAMRAARQRGENVGTSDVDDLFTGNGTPYRGSWREQGQVQTYRPGSTIRANRGRRAGTAIGGSSSSSSVSNSALAGVVVGYASSRINPDYTASLSSSSSSGGSGSTSSSSSSSSSSYGGGGGGFSGSGSSSSY